MINSKRISKLKKDIKDKIGDIKYIKFNVKTKEGLYMIDINAPGESKYIKIDKPIEELITYDFSEYSVKDILIVGDGKTEPVSIVDDIPYKEKIIKGYLNNPEEPFKDFTNDELIEISDIK